MTYPYIPIHKLVSPQIFSTGFLEELFHTIKQWMRITRPQEVQIDYKITRRINWSRGSVTKENMISDQFIIRFITSLANYK